MKAKPGKNLKLKDGRWFFDITKCGKRYIRLAGNTKDEAVLALAKFRAKLDAGPEVVPAEVEDPLFEDFAQEYIKTYAKPGPSYEGKRSWKRDEYSIAHLGAFIGKRRLSEISLLLIEKYRRARGEQGAKLGTINRELACLKGILSKAVDWEKLESFPLRKIKINLRDEEPRDRILTREEEAQLLEAAAPHLRPMITLALNTGMRRGEILKLRAEHVNLAERLIVIPKENAKGKRPRTVPLTAAAIRVLQPLLRDSGFVFCKPNGKPYEDISAGFKAACERAKIRDLRFHDLRRTFETRSLAGGANPVNIVKIMGHHSIPFSLEHYFHPSAARLLEGLETALNTKECKPAQPASDRRANN